MRRIAVINQKGGVGKTTTCANLGAALALQGRRVVVVDMDAQANLSLTLNTEIESDTPSSYTVLTGATSFAQALRTTSIPGLSLVASNLDLSGAELELASALGREFLLRDALKAWTEEARAKHEREPADYVLFDCPPSLGLLSINALAASGEVLITIQTEFLALQGMSKLVEIVQLLRRRLNPELTITGILPCLYDSRLKLAREVLGEIRSFFPGQVLERPIRANVKLAEAPSYGKTIFEYAPGSNGADDYMRAAEELMKLEARHAELAGLPPYRGDLPALVNATQPPKVSGRRPPPPRPKKDATISAPVGAAKHELSTNTERVLAKAAALEADSVAPKKAATQAKHTLVPTKPTPAPKPAPAEKSESKVEPGPPRKPVKQASTPRTTIAPAPTDALVPALEPALHAPKTPQAPPSQPKPSTAAPAAQPKSPTPAPAAPLKPTTASKPSVPAKAVMPSKSALRADDLPPDAFEILRTLDGSS